MLKGNIYMVTTAVLQKDGTPTQHQAAQQAALAESVADAARLAEQDRTKRDKDIQDDLKLGAYVTAIVVELKLLDHEIVTPPAVVLH